MAPTVSTKSKSVEDVAQTIQNALIKHVSAWYVPLLALPAALALGGIAEADFVTKQYADLIYLIDSCPFYTQSSGLTVAVAHKYPSLARLSFANPAFPDACVLLVYTPYMRKHMNRDSRRIIPRLWTFSLPENGGLSFTAKELAEKALAAAVYPADTETAAAPDIRPCPVPPPPKPLYAAAAGAAGLLCLSGMSLFTPDTHKWLLALVVGALLGVMVTRLRHQQLRAAASKYRDLCVAAL